FSLLKTLLDYILCELKIFKPQRRFWRYEFKDGMTLFLDKLRLNIGYDVYFFQRINRELRSWLKCPDTIYFITEKFNPVGEFVGKRKYIDNTTANCKLTCFIYEVSFFKIVIVKELFQKFNVEFFANLNRESIGGKGPFVDYFFT